MISWTEGGMVSELGTESFGGNAGYWESFPCAGVRFYYDRGTGEIVTFGNFQNVRRQIRENFPEGIFKVAILMGSKKPRVKRDLDYRIIEIYYESAQILDVSRQVLEKSMEEFNERYGFDI